MTLVELLKPELIFPKINCACKDGFIAELVDSIYDRCGELPISREDLLKTINTRESIGGTLLPSGLFIPHARLKNFDDFVLAIATPAQPLFHAGLEIRLSAMMITSQTGRPWYLETLAALTKISRDTEFVTRLSGADNPQDFINILRERDSSLS